MGRLVIVSNRVSVPKKGAQAGGLAVALKESLERHGGLWFGWSGEVAEDRVPPPKSMTQRGITYVTTDLTRQDYEEFYNGFSNSTLWPLFHFRLGLLEVSRKSYEGYLRVNAAFAAALAPMLRPDDVVWVHDYHLIPLGDELRRLGVTNRMGFFLHTPFPVPELLVALPGHRRLVRAMCAYDLVGFQTRDDVRAFLGYVAGEISGDVGENGHFSAFGRYAKTEAYPIGIDTNAFAELAEVQADAPETQQLIDSLQGRQLILGVERLDYSKGLPHRFDAIECLLECHPEFSRAFEFMQIAAPSREDVARYRALKRQLESAAGRINGRFAEFDWQPVRYINKGYDRASLAGFYRAASVGLVTPLRDGMNLVAKEYVAAQQADNPGVLVLSRFAGSARELTSALIVNPFDVNEVADALAKALTMPRGERVERWRAMMKVIEANTVETWRDAFLSDLTEGMSSEFEDEIHADEEGVGLEAPSLPLAPVAQPPGLLR
ncbi:MAG: alpha,alpha-trehalose-phosphate synthase (UDP-forming) [Rhodospirillaceae bacterium]|nr:alpha,alpha-trehalose-phosphate synthase (UDP-forming) [Rhodospirillales bacterium]